MLASDWLSPMISENQSGKKMMARARDAKTLACAVSRRKKVVMANHPLVAKCDRDGDQDARPGDVVENVPNLLRVQRVRVEAVEDHLRRINDGVQEQDAAGNSFDTVHHFPPYTLTGANRGPQYSKFPGPGVTGQNQDTLGRLESSPCPAPASL